MNSPIVLWQASSTDIERARPSGSCIKNSALLRSSVIRYPQIFSGERRPCREIFKVRAPSSRQTSIEELSIALWILVQYFPSTQAPCCRVFGVQEVRSLNSAYSLANAVHAFDPRAWELPPHRQVAYVKKSDRSPIPYLSWYLMTKSPSSKSFISEITQIPR